MLRGFGMRRIAVSSPCVFLANLSPKRDLGTNLIHHQPPPVARSPINFTDHDSPPNNPLTKSSSPPSA